MSVSQKVTRLFTIAFSLFIFTQCCDMLSAQLKPPTSKSYGGSNGESKKLLPGIGWYGILDDGLKEAAKTGKPILLISAAPQCNGVPGMW